MKFGLFAPQVKGQPQDFGLSIYPARDVVDSQTRLFVMSENVADASVGDLCAQTVGQYLQNHFNSNKLFTPQMLQAALDEARTALNGHEGTSLAAVCFHRGGVLMATVGSMQVHHIRRAEGRVLFSSVVNVGTVEGNDMPLIVRTTDVKPDDDFYITSGASVPLFDDEQLLGVVQQDDACGLVVTVETVQAEAADSMQPNDEAFSRYNARLLPRKNGGSSSGKRTGLVVGLVLAAILLAAGGWYAYEYFMAKKEKAKPKPEPTKVVPDTTATDTVPAEAADSTVDATPQTDNGGYYSDPVVMPYSDPGPYVEPAEVEQENNKSEPAADNPAPAADDDVDDETDEPASTGGGVPPPPPRNKRGKQPQPVPPPPSR